jgi:hypothetical protein
MFHRLVPILLALAATLAQDDSALSRSAHGSSGPSAGRMRTFSAEGISFSYPASWHTYQFPWASRFSTSLAYVSNVPLHRPCVGQPLGPGCQGPVSALPANSALLIWTENGFPTWTFRRAQGTLLRINGRRARLQRVAPQAAWCPRYTSTMLEVVIERPEAADNWYDLRACISGPRTVGVQRQVMAILYSFHALR